MSIEAIKAQRDQVQAQIGAVNIQIAQQAVSEIKGLARVAGLRVKVMKGGKADAAPKRAVSPQWTHDEDVMIRQFYNTRGCAWLQRELLQSRTYWAIAARAQKLGVQGAKS